MTISSLNVYTWAHGVTVGSFIGTLIVDTHPAAQGSIGKVEGFRWSFLSGINLPSYLTCFHPKTDTSVISNYCDQTVCFVWIEWNPAGLWQAYLCCDPLKSSWKCVTFRGNIVTVSGHIWYYSAQMKCLLHTNAQRSIFPSAAILCSVFLFKWVRDLLQNSIFYVTVRTRSAWPIFGAPWRQCFSSVHWKPWLQYFITISQRLQRIRRWSYEEHQLSARADRGEELSLVSLAEHAAAWHRHWYGLNSRFVIPHCRILQIPQKTVSPLQWCDIDELLYRM